MKQDIITDQDIIAANRQFDLQFPHFLRRGSQIRSSWSEVRLSMGGRISDRKVEAYREQGFYSADLKMARAAYQARNRWFRSL